MNPDVGIKFFVFDFVDVDINIDSDAQVGLQMYLMNVLIDFDDLRHNYNLLDDLLQNIRNLYDLLNSAAHWDYLLLITIHILNLVLNEILGVLLDHQLLNLHDLLLVANHLLHHCLAFLNSHHFLLQDLHFLYLLAQQGDLNWPLSNAFDHLVYMDYHGNLTGQFHQLRNCYNPIAESFDFVYLRNLVANSDDFLNHNRDFNNSLLILDNWHGTLHLNLTNPLADIWSDFLHLLYPLTEHWLLNYLHNLFDSCLLGSNLNDLFDLLEALHSPLNHFLANYHLLNASIHWNRHLDWHHCRPIDLDHFLHLDNLAYDSLHENLFRNFPFNLNHFLGFFLYHLYRLNKSLYWHHFFNDLFHDSVNLVVNIPNHFDLDYLFLNYWHLNYLLHLHNSLHFHDPVHNPLNDLRNLDYLLNDSRHNNDLLDNLFNLYDLGDFNHLFDNLVDVDSHFLYPFDGSWNLDDLFYDYLDRIVLSNVDIDWFFNLDYVVHLHNLVNVFNHLHNSRNLHPLHADLSDNLRNPQDLLLIERHLHSTVNDLLHLFHHCHNVVHYSLDLFYSVPVDNLLLDHLHLLDSWHLDFYFHQLWHNLYDLNDLFDCLNDWDEPLYVDLNDLGQLHNVINNLSCISILNDFDWLFNDSVEGLYHLDHSLHDLLLDNLHSHHLLDDLLNNHDLLLNHLDLSDLRNSVIHDLLNIDRLLNLHYLLNNHLDLYYLGDFHDSLYNPLNYSRHFHDLLRVTLHLHNLLDDLINVFDNLNWNMDNSLYLLNLNDFDWLLHDLFNGDHLGDLHHSLHNLLHYLLHLHNLRHHSEHLQDIIN